MNSVAIIGAGITGLTAAFRLRSRGVAVRLYEAGPRVGGVIQSVRAEGYLAEFGPNTVLETSPKIAALIHDVGLEDQRLYSNPAANKRFLVRRRRPIELPGSPLAFFASPLFSARAKLRLLAEPFIRRAPSDVEENLAAFVIRRLGQEFLDYAINPFVAGVYAGDPARLSVRQAFPKLHAVEQRYGSLILGQFLGARERRRRGEVSKQNAPKLSFAGGLQTLTDTLGARLGDCVRLSAEVVEATRTDSSWRLTVRGAGGDSVETHAAVLCAVPTYRFPMLRLEDRTPVDVAHLSDIRYPPVVSVVLGYRRDDVAHPLDGFGVLVPQIEGLRILGTIFSSSLFPNRAPEGHVALTSYVGGTRAPNLTEEKPERLATIVAEDLAVLLGARGRPTFQHSMYYPKAIPQYDVGYGRFRDWFGQTEQRAPGLFFAGHYRDGISLGDSIVSGCDVAERISTWFERAGCEGHLASAGAPTTASL